MMSDHYEMRIDDLKDQIKELEAENKKLEKALKDARGNFCDYNMPVRMIKDGINKALGEE